MKDYSSIIEQLLIINQQLSTQVTNLTNQVTQLAEQQLHTGKQINDLHRAFFATPEVQKQATIQDRKAAILAKEYQKFLTQKNKRP